MKLWRLVNDGPDGEEDDSFFEIVIFVLAATAADARSLAREYRVLINAPCEDVNLWLDDKRSTCREVPTSGEPGVICWASYG